MTGSLVPYNMNTVHTHKAETHKTFVIALLKNQVSLHTTCVECTTISEKAFNRWRSRETQKGSALIQGKSLSCNLSLNLTTQDNPNWFTHSCKLTLTLRELTLTSYIYSFPSIITDTGLWQYSFLFLFSCSSQFHAKPRNTVWIKGAPWL